MVAFFFGRFAFCLLQAFGILQRYFCLSTGHYGQISDLKRAFGSKSMPANWPKSFPKVPVQHVLNAGTLIPMCDLYSSMGNPKTCISNFRSLVEKKHLFLLSFCIIMAYEWHVTIWLQPKKPTRFRFHRHRRHGTFCNTSLVPPRTSTTSKTSWDSKRFSKRSSIDLTQKDVGTLLMGGILGVFLVCFWLEFWGCHLLGQIDLKQFAGRCWYHVGYIFFLEFPTSKSKLGNKFGHLTSTSESFCWISLGFQVPSGGMGPEFLTSWW